MNSSSSCATVLFFFSVLLLVANYIDAGSVIFIDSKNHRYFRPSLNQEDSYSSKEAGAAISVLLGINPPPSLSISSSKKLNELLVPNPFARPRAVLTLEVSGVSDSPFTLFDDPSSKKALIDSDETQMLLPGEDIIVASLDTGSKTTYTDKEISEFALWFGGSYNRAIDSLSGELIFPLPNGNSLKLQMSEEADRMFVLNLINLFNNIEDRATAHLDLPHGTRRPSELLTGCFRGLTILRNRYGSGDVVNQGFEALLATVYKVFETLKTAYKNEIVAVVFLKNEEEELMKVVTSHGSMRMLSDSDVSKNATDKETKLARSTLTWVTAIILLVSSLIGIYLLVNMPLTKDTLLYSNVKLD